jgi:thiol-disulfide isomerase/thioredoxin
MKTFLLLILGVISISVSAQNGNPEFASAPLNKKSIGKRFDRSVIEAALPHHNLQGKYILLDVFFQACGPCRASIPYLNELADTTKFPQLQVVSIDPFFKDTATMDEFIRHFKIKYPVLKGQEAYDIGSRIKNRGYPFAFLIDPTGKIIAMEFGFSPEGFEAFERKLKVASKPGQDKSDKAVIFTN